MQSPVSESEGGKCVVIGYSLVTAVPLALISSIEA
jgi:hypothetical protein